MGLLTNETLTREQYLGLSDESREELLHEEFDCPVVKDEVDDDDIFDW